MFAFFSIAVAASTSKATSKKNADPEKPRRGPGRPKGSKNAPKPAPIAPLVLPPSVSRTASSTRNTKTTSSGRTVNPSRSNSIKASARNANSTVIDISSDATTIIANSTSATTSSKSRRSKSTVSTPLPVMTIKQEYNGTDHVLSGCPSTSGWVGRTASGLAVHLSRHSQIGSTANGTVKSSCVSTVSSRNQRGGNSSTRKNNTNKNTSPVTFDEICKYINSVNKMNNNGVDNMINSAPASKTKNSRSRSVTANDIKSTVNTVMPAPPEPPKKRKGRPPAADKLRQLDSKSKTITKRKTSAQTDPKKREQHNNMERKRRNEMKLSFSDIKVLIYRHVDGADRKNPEKLSKFKTLIGSMSYLGQLSSKETAYISRRDSRLRHISSFFRTLKLLRGRVEYYQAKLDRLNKPFLDSNIC